MALHKLRKELWLNRFCLLAAMPFVAALMVNVVSSSTWCTLLSKYCHERLKVKQYIDLFQVAIIAIRAVGMFSKDDICSQCLYFYFILSHGHAQHAVEGLSTQKNFCKAL